MRAVHTDRTRAIGGLTCLWLVLVWAGGSASTAGPPDGGQLPAAAVSPQTCLDCHSGPETERLPSFHNNCTGCHRGAADHVAAPSADNIQRPEAPECLACHTRSAALANWELGSHSQARVQCRECHSPHRPALRPELRNVAERRMDGASTACKACHEDSAASFLLPSRHPVREGGLSCVSCHDPHGRDAVKGLSRTDRCVSCHPSQRGPFVFEHAPAIEDCANCHVPHGSPNRRLAEVPAPGLCLQCHSLADNRHAENAVVGARVTGGALRNCAGCHAAIHGSHTDPYLRY